MGGRRWGGREGGRGGWGGHPLIHFAHISITSRTEVVQMDLSKMGNPNILVIRLVL